MQVHCKRCKLRIWKLLCEVCDESTPKCAWQVSDRKSLSHLFGELEYYWESNVDLHSRFWSILLRKGVSYFQLRISWPRHMSLDLAWSAILLHCHLCSPFSCILEEREVQTPVAISSLDKQKHRKGSREHPAIFCSKTWRSFSWATFCGLLVSPSKSVSLPIFAALKACAVCNKD